MPGAGLLRLALSTWVPPLVLLSVAAMAAWLAASPTEVPRDEGTRVVS